MRYAIGSQVPLPVAVRDGSGAYVDAAAVSVTVWAPDGTVAGTYTLGGGTVTRTSTGLYVAYHVPTVANRHTWQASTTTPTTVGQPDTFRVVASTDAPLIGLGEARSELGAVASAVGDQLLYDKLAAASDSADRYCNRHWRRTTVVEDHDGGRLQLHLREQPVVSVTTVVEQGTTLTPGTDYQLRTLTGELLRGGPLTRLRWFPGVNAVRVTYVAGPENDVVPDDITTGVLELVKHLLASLRGGSNLPRQDYGDDSTEPGAQHAIPWRVAEAWEPYRIPSGGYE